MNRDDIKKQLESKDKEIEALKNELKTLKDYQQINEAYFKNAQRIGKFGFWHLDIKSNKFTWSDEIYKLFELKSQKAEFTYNAFLEAIHPDDREMVNQAYTKSLKTRKPYQIIHRLLTKDGKIKFVQERCETIFDERFHPVSSTGILIDITERLQTEKNLRAQNEEFIALSEEYKSQNDELFEKNKELEELVEANRKANEKIHIKNIQLKKQNEEYSALNEEYLAINDEIKSQNKELKIAKAEIAKANDKNVEANLRLLDAQRIAKVGSYQLSLTNGEWTSSLVLNSIFGIKKNYKKTFETWLDIVHEDDRKMIKDYLLKEVLEKNKNFDKEYRIKKINDGKIRWVHGFGELKYNYQGDLLHMTGSIQDITDRKEKEDRLAESEERFRSFMETATDMMNICDADLNLIYVNNSMCKTLGYKENELLGKHVSVIFKPEEKEKRFKDKIHSQLIKTGRLDYETIWLTKKGEEIYGELKVVAINDEKKKFAGSRAVFHNTTEQKQTLEKLKKSEAQYRSLYNNSTVGLYRTTPDGQILLSNETIVKLLKYDSFEDLSKLNLENKKISKKIQREEFKNIIEKNGEVVDIESKWIARDGSEVWVRESAKAIKDDNGKIIFYEGTIEDITKRRIAEKALIESEEKYKALVENSYDGIYIYKDNKFMFVNQTIVNILGYSEEELYKANIWDIIHHDDRERILDISRRRAKGEEVPSSYTAKVVCKNGEIKLAEFAVRIIKYENGYAVLGTVRDITERIIAEEKLKESEAKYRTMTELLPQFVYEADLKGNAITVNNQGYKMFGYTKDELKGKHLSVFEYIDKADHERLTSNLKNRATQDSDIANEYIGIKKDGTKFPIKVYTSVVYKGKMPVGYRGIIIDLSKQKLQEEELIKEKTRAEESDRLKSAFLANMSHEIRTPMNGVIGFAELLADRDLDHEDRIEYVKIIQNSSHQLLGIINDIIDISKIETGIIEVNNEAVNVNDLLIEQQEFFNNMASEKGLALSFKEGLPEEKSEIYTDEQKLKQIITNLVGNAIKFTEKGQIAFGYELKEEFLEFYVCDTGIGINKEQQNLIFQPFRQIEETVTRKYGGAGLGLHISKAYVEALGGKIYVDSILGQGATFIFTIPYRPVDNKFHKILNEENNITNLDWSNKKILIAEDEEMNYFYLERVLLESNAQLIHVKDGEEAVEVCRTNYVDLVLMDLKMPKMNGYEAIAEIRKFNKEIPIIAQTAFALSDDKSKAMKAGCNDHIAKPINRKQLLDKINTYINK